MMMQTGRYLIGCYKECKAGIRQASSVGYLNDVEKTKKRISPAQTVQDICNLEDLVSAYDCICAHLVSDVGEQHISVSGSKHDGDDSFELCGGFL